LAVGTLLALAQRVEAPSPRRSPRASTSRRRKPRWHPTLRRRRAPGCAASLDLIRHWAKDARIATKMINARAETLLERSSYRGLIGRRRCLIAADGFYEWRIDAAGRRQPIRFNRSDLQPFAFAGLWTSWGDRETGELVESCTIITTTANELVALVHDRMPVILPREPGACAPAAHVEERGSQSLSPARRDRREPPARVDGERPSTERTGSQAAVTESASADPFPPRTTSRPQSPHPASRTRIRPTRRNDEADLTNGRRFKKS
jgi:hypothetical protein